MNYHFDFDEWPAASEHEETKMKPYSGSLFELRDNFTNIFPEYKMDTNEEKDKE